MRTDPETTRSVRSWLEDGRTALPDYILDAVLEQLPATPQRRSLWPARRIADMNTLAKLGGLAAAVIIVVGGAVLILGGGIGRDLTGAPSPLPTPAIPTGAPPSTGPATTDAALLPGEFSACLPNNSQFKAGTYEEDVVSTTDGGVTIERTRGFTWRGAITATDPRFTGTHYYSWDANGYTPGSADPQLPTGIEDQVGWAEGHRIENDEGAWQGWAVGVSLPDGTQVGSPAVLTGEGAYEGLSAVLLSVDGLCFFDYRGLVMEVPEPPVPYTGG